MAEVTEPEPVAEVAVDVTGASTAVTGASKPEAAPVTVSEPDPVTVPEPELVPEPVTAEVTPVGAEVTGPVTGAAAEVLVPVTAEVTEPMAEVTGPVAELVVAVAAEVTVLVAEVAADVTGAAAEVLVLVAPEVPEPELALVPVTAEVTEPMADVTGPVAEVSGPVAEVSGPAGGAVAAWAWRENASRATRIPAATIATCTTRRAMSRTIGCGMSSSPTPGDGPNPACSTCYQRP
jgi:hypothetical protein